MLNIHEIAPHVNIDKKCFEKIQFLLVDIRFYTAIFDAVQNLHGRPVLHHRAVFVFISKFHNCYLTVIVHVAIAPDFMRNVITAFPFRFAVTFPFEFTVTIFLSEDFQLETLSPYVLDFILMVAAFFFLMVRAFLFKDTFAFNLGVFTVTFFPQSRHFPVFFPVERAVAFFNTFHFLQ